MCGCSASRMISTRHSRTPAGWPTSSSWPKLMCRDALDREESAGGHFRVEHQTEEGEAKRDDVNFSHVSAWEWNGRASAASNTQSRSSSNT